MVVEKSVGIHFDLDGEDCNLISSNLHLVGLAVELKALNWVNEVANPLVWGLLLSLDEREFDVSFKIVAHVLERYFKFLNTRCFLDG